MRQSPAWSTTRSVALHAATLALLAAFPLAGCGTSSRPAEAQVVQRRAFSIPHILEKSGRVTDTTFTFDTQIFAAYSGGAAGLGGGGPQSTTLRMYLFDSTGDPVEGSAGGEICNPCTYSFGPGMPAKVGIDLDQILNEAGFFQNRQFFQGFALFTVEGDVDRLALQGVTQYSQSSPGDISVFLFWPEELPRSAQ